MSISKVKKFVKNHKYDIVIVGGIIMIVVGGVVIYKTGFKSGVNAALNLDPNSTWHCQTADGSKFIFTSDVVSKAGEYTINQTIDSDQAINIAKFILKETGCIKELVKVGAEIAEVAANG